MGTFATGDITIGFKENATVPTEFVGDDTLNKALQAYCAENNGGAESYTGIDMVDVDEHNHIIRIKFSSPRVQNAEFTLDLLLEYLRKKYPNDVDYFESQGYVPVDGMSYYFDGEEEWADNLNNLDN